MPLAPGRTPRLDSGRPMRVTARYYIAGAEGESGALFPVSGPDMEEQA